METYYSWEDAVQEQHLISPLILKYSNLESIHAIENQIEPFEGYSQYFQILDLPEMDLIGNSNGTWLNPTDSYNYDFISEFGRDLDLLFNEDNSIFYFTSLSEFFAGPDIYVRKVGIDGQIYWDAPKNLTNDSSSDNFVKKVFNAPDGGAFIVFDQVGSGNFGNISIITELYISL